MSVTANNAVIDIPMTFNYAIGYGSASNKINAGDWLKYSGQAVEGTAIGAASPSGAGIALQANPTFDQAGRVVTATALLFAREGVFRVSAAFSGAIPLGTPVYPTTTGSAVGAPTGLTGVGATWQTAAPTLVSGTAAPSLAVGRVVGWYNTGPAGTGQMDVLITYPHNAAGYY